MEKYRKLDNYCIDLYGRKIDCDFLIEILVKRMGNKFVKYVSIFALRVVLNCSSEKWLILVQADKRRSALRDIN